MRKSHLERAASLLILSIGLTACAPGTGLDVGRIQLDVDRTRLDSPLHSVIDAGPASTDRRAILRRLPIGSDRDRIKTFLAQNFRGVGFIVRSAPAPLCSEPAPSGRCVYFRPRHTEALMSYDRVEVYLLLDATDHLKDVVVYSRHDSI
ncbi:MAG TPA: hypothetical protein VGO11_14290 [Chthoniobacteraceae bacterium]|jgi:hypothetical protein|nr:hypothetical protein [Chthoniobacteraceae bacterium]